MPFPFTPRRSSRPSSRTGAVTVEFAFIAPVLFLFIFAALEFVRAHNVIHTVDHAVYEGARRGIVPGATASTVREVSLGILRTVGVRNATIEVAPATIEPTTATVRVDIEVPLSENGFINPIFFRNRVVRSTMTMSREVFSQSSTP